EDGLALRARGEMLVDGDRARQIELLIEIGVQAALCFGAVHIRTPRCFADAAAGASARERGATSRCRSARSRPPRSPCTRDPRARAARSLHETPAAAARARRSPAGAHRAAGGCGR